MFFLSFMVWGQNAKNPRLTWQSRVSEKLFLGLELHSHDAKNTGITLPNGHTAGDWRVLHQFCKRGFHIQPAGKKHYLAAFVKKFFCGANCLFRGLSVDWFQV
jgi:hypothetical protein